MNSQLRISILVGGIFFLLYLAFFHYTNIHEVGVMRNIISGELTTDKPGFHFSSPWVLVAKLDTRFQKVCATSHARVMNCKMGRFIPENYQALVEREGFRYYWWDNRISFNFGYDEEYRGERDLIRGYTFTEEKVSFIETKTN